jgi:hypothetical protein
MKSIITSVVLVLALTSIQVQAAFQLPQKSVSLVPHLELLHKGKVVEFKSPSALFQQLLKLQRKGDNLSKIAIYANDKAVAVKQPLFREVRKVSSLTQSKYISSVHSGLADWSDLLDDKKRPAKWPAKKVAKEVAVLNKLLKHQFWQKDQHNQQVIALVGVAYTQNLIKMLDPGKSDLLDELFTIHQQFSKLAQ